MQVELANMRRLWRVIDYLQSDAEMKGILRNDSQQSTFGSFWNNMDEIIQAKRQNRLYVVTDTRQHLIAYFITRDTLEHGGHEGTLYLEIIEVLPRNRNRGVGTFVVEFLEEKAKSVGFHSIGVRPANGSEPFWNRLGFTDFGDRYGYLLLPIA